MRSEMTLRIRELREMRGISLWQMAAAIGITGGYLSLIERGHRTLSVALEDRIAAYLDVRPSELVTIERESIAPVVRVDRRRRPSPA